MSAATVFISESNQAGEVVTDNISNINFGSVDQPNIVTANHPVIVGEFSYQKYLRFKVASLGTSTTIKDLRYWKSAGVYVTNENIYTINLATAVAGVPYATPTQAQLPGSFPQPILTGDPGSPNVGIGGILAGTIAAPGYSDYFGMVTQSNVATPVGPANTKTLTFQYDET